MEIITMGIMLVFVLLLYFVLLRPQRKREERYALMVASVKPGAMVYAGGGIYGQVLAVRERTFIMESSKAKTRLIMDSDSIEAVDNFDYKAEKARQKALRAAKGAASTSRLKPRR